MIHGSQISADAAAYIWRTYTPIGLMKRMRATAFVLLIAMIFNLLPLQVFAEDVQNDQKSEEQLREELRTAIDETKLNESGEVERYNECPIDQFMVKSDDNNVYVMWTENEISYREGIDPNSSEEAEPDNRFSEKHIYAARQIMGDISLPASREQISAI